MLREPGPPRLARFRPNSRKLAHGGPATDYTCSIAATDGSLPASNASERRAAGTAISCLTALLLGRNWPAHVWRIQANEPRVKLHPHEAQLGSSKVHIRLVVYRRLFKRLPARALELLAI